MTRFTLRDVFWLMLVVGLAAPAAKSDAREPVVESAISHEEETLTLRGRVLDDQGQAIPEALVVLPRQSPISPRAKGLTSRTNKRGEFEIALPKDWQMTMHRLTDTILWASAKHHALSTLSAHSAMFSKSKETLEFRLGPAATTSFVIVDPSGKPVPGASVSPQSIRTRRAYDLVPDEMRPMVTGVTDQEGRVRLTAAHSKGLFRVHVTSKDFGTQEKTLNAEVENAKERTIRLQTVGRVEGRVTSEDPRWVGSIPILLETGELDATETPRGFAIVETNQAGEFSVPNIAIGELHFGVFHDQRLPFRASLPIGYNVASGSTTSVKVALVKGVLVKGCLEESGTPLVGACVSVSYGQRRQADTVFTNDEGRFEARVLPGAVFQRVIAMPRPGLVQQNANTRITVPADVDDFELPDADIVLRK